MSKSSIRNSAAPVKEDSSETIDSPQHRGTRLIPIALKRTGRPSETIYLPQCFVCGEVILNLKMANVSTVAATNEELVPLGKLGDADALLIPSDGAFAVHKRCDETGRAPWVTAHCVFRSDQRREFERRAGSLL